MVSYKFQLSKSKICTPLAHVAVKVVLINVSEDMQGNDFFFFFFFFFFTNFLLIDSGYPASKDK